MMRMLNYFEIMQGLGWNCEQKLSNRHRKKVCRFRMCSFIRTEFEVEYTMSTMTDIVIL